MKKILLTLLIVTLFSPFTAGAKQIAPEAAVPTLTSVASPVAEITTTSIEIEENIEEIQYDLYYADTCGWCQKLDKFLIENNAYEKLNINKIDVKIRGDEMVEAAEAHGINPASVGTPFLTYGPNGTGSAIDSGYYGALEVFAEALNISVDEAETQTQNNGGTNRLYVILFGLLIIIGPLAYLGLKK